jgi:CheY-specific phosphatase CheX
MENIKKIEQILTTATFEVLEKMFFVFSEPLRDEPPPAFQWRARIAFAGPFAGEMRLSLTTGLARTLARNMLNLGRDEITPPVIADCAKESLNMICGNFLRHVDPAQRATLSIPTCEAIAAPAENAAAQDGTALALAFSTDDGPFEIRLLQKDGRLEND